MTHDLSTLPKQPTRRLVSFGMRSAHFVRNFARHREDTWPPTRRQEQQRRMMPADQSFVESVARRAMQFRSITVHEHRGAIARHHREQLKAFGDGKRGGAILAANLRREARRWVAEQRDRIEQTVRIACALLLRAEAMLHELVAASKAREAKS